MKLNLKLAAATAAALLVPVAIHADTATLTSAQITQIIKDVQTIDPGKGARNAVMKETLAGQQAVRTGIDSRTELLFNDHTISRLGSNTHFSFTEGTRNMSLESGVMLLQVPKGNGGAKIETAAVTAAVTGTTIMIEAGLNYTKLIVLDGECCIWPKNDKIKNELFKFKHKTCVHEGQEVILRNGAKEIPDPVYVNLKVLENTSLLITGDWNSPLNTTPINTAANNQGPGTYIPTNLAIIGAGTDVTVIQGQLPPPGSTPPPSNNTPPPGPIPSKYGPLGTIPGSSTLGGGTTINTDPKIIAGGQTSYGRIYRGTILDGQPVPYLFGAGSTASFPDLAVDDKFPQYGVAAFKFGSLHIQGMPSFQASGNGATAVALVSLGDITLSAPSPTTLDFSTTPVTELALGTAGGNIDIDSSMSVQGLDRLELYSYGTSNNIEVDGNVNVNDKYYATTLGSYTQNGTVYAGNNAIVLAGNLALNNSITTNYGEIDLESQGNFSGDGGSVSASYVTLVGGVQMTLDEQSGDGEGPNTDTVNGIQIDMNPLDSLNITGNGVVIDNGFLGESYQEEQYEETPYVDLTLTSLDNGVAGSGTISLDGSIYVDEFTATADSNITLQSTGSVESNYDVYMTSNNGGIEIDGPVYADNGYVSLQAEQNITVSAPASTNGIYGTNITSYSGTVNVQGSIIDSSYININAGGDITTGSEAYLSTADGDEVDEEYTSISLTASGTATVDGDIESGTVSITGYNVHTLTTDAKREGGIYGEVAVNIYAANDVTLDGYIQTPSFTITAIPGGAVPANVTLSGSGEVDADNVTINAGIVELEGFIGGDENEFGSSQVRIDTSGGSGPLVNNGGSMQDFYSTSGNGAIDGQTISITSRGDLILDDPGNETSLVHKLEEPPPDDGSDTSQNVNGVLINPYDDLVELDLTGTSIEVPDGFQIDYPTTIRLTSTSGDITLGGDISLGTDSYAPAEFDATTPGNIDVTTDMQITADNVNLSAGQISTGEATLYIQTHNASVTTSNAIVSIENDSDFPTNFYLTEYGTGEGNPYVGSVTVTYSGTGSESLSVSANSIVTDNIYGYAYDSLSISLTSANDINGGDDESAGIYAATSVALQVGVPATLAGDDSSYISYNGGQLYIDNSNLSFFSVTASSIEVDEGFPELYNDTSLSLTATGANGDTNGITVNAPLYVQNAGITLNAENGDVTISAPLTAGAGGISITGNDIIVNSVSEISTTRGDSGSVSLTAQSGSISIGSSITPGPGGNVTLNAATSIVASDIITGSGGSLIATGTSGDVSFLGALSISGSFVASAGGNIFIGLPDPTIGGDMSLTAGGSIELDNSITINGNLTLEAGNYIHTPTGATITGATSVTVALTNNPGVMSVSGTTLHFGVPAGLEEEGYGTIGIDLTDVISGDSSITGSATSLTFSGGFNQPGVTLNLAATSGSLNVTGSGTVHVDDFNPSSSGGDLDINEAVIAEDNIYAVAYGGDVNINAPISSPSMSLYTYDSGNINIKAEVTSPSFYADATSGNVVINQEINANSSAVVYGNTITGTGSIVSPNINVQASAGTATLTQTSASQFSYNGTLTLNTASDGFQQITLSAPVLTLGSAINFGGSVDIVDGSINTQGNTITSEGLYLISLKTVTDSGGNATGLTGQGDYYVMLDGVSLNGSGSGNGGTLNVSATVPPDEVTSSVTLQGTVSANGGNSGGNGGSITLTSANNINTEECSSLEALGGIGGGNGGTINLTAQNGTIYSLPIDASGGSASPTGTTPGGNGGSISLTASTDLEVDSTITANGGDANPNSGAAGGNGGSVTLDTDGNLTLYGNITATSGANGNSKWTGGNGGTVSLTAAGAVTVNSTIEVSSSDLVKNRVSARGGNINVTSHAAAGNTAININNSGQLVSLLNQAAAGPGGQITFLADQGGNINVSGSLRADAGTIDIRTTGTATGGQVNLNAGAFLSADVIKAGVLSPNGTLTVGGGEGGPTRMNGDTLISLYAAGDNGSVVFAGNTILTGAGIKSIAGSTVTVNNGVNVLVSGGAATVYTNTPNYQGSGGNNSTTGQFIGNTNTTTKSFSSRPAF